MKKYLNTLLVILTFLFVLTSSVLVFTNVTNYSQGTIWNNESIIYLITSEEKIYKNQKKQIIVNNKKIYVKIIQKQFNNQMYFYLIESLPFEMQNKNCNIKMNSQILIVFLFQKILKIA